ncbi:MAG: cyd operon YbgE family protein [Rhodocyclaceae bacterium]|jgi:predicted membrane protein|nr:cyd operon YbgE family protein [Rhodocyclaceae bacterium]
MVALAITLTVTIYPRALAGPDGGADHWAAMALFWAMSAGYVRGVGFIPRQTLLRAIFSTWACLLGTALGFLSLAIA